MTSTISTSENTTGYGTLYVVATPIGNLNDLSFRAVEVLKAVDFIAAEDTRIATRLLKNFSITTQTIAYHDHNENNKTQGLINKLMSGLSVALISDAGTPLISDPGYRLTQLAHKNNIRVRTVAGPCAAIAALSVSGLPSDAFSFYGFLPNKRTQRIASLERLSLSTHTLIFYESPHRIVASLEDLISIFGGDRLACLCREMTKTYETIKQAKLDELYKFVSSDSNQQRGEIVLVISGYQEPICQDQTASLTILKLLLDELPLKKAASITSQLTGLSKNELYQLGLTLKSD